MESGRILAVVAVAALLSGCVYAYHSMGVGPRYATHQRPDASYFCYDCHGYRFFDPYYDWCPPNGFVYRWDRPRVVRMYRERYVALKRQDRSLGRFEYPERYRASRRYREPRDYDTWLQERNQPDDRPSIRERRAKDRGTKKDPPSGEPKKKRERSRGRTT